MVFRRRASKQTEAERSSPATEPDGAADDLSPDPAAILPPDRALDFVADLLRVLGEHAFDVGAKEADDIQRFFETWARHLLIGIPPPSLEDADEGADDAGTDTSESAPNATRKRDLPGLRRAVKEHRLAEADYVTTSLGQFREAAWAFISGMRRSLSIEQNADRRIGHRMRRLEGAVRSGDAARIKAEAQETVGLLTEFLAERGTRHEAEVSAMARKLEGLREELDSVRRQAAVDSLTQIYNRAAFDEQIEREIDLASLFGKRGCLVMVDIDHFKWVNDTHGHPCGDEVLRRVAETLDRCFMRRDDFVARYGGEEFAIVLRDITLPVARDVAERGMMAIRNLEIPWNGLEEPIRITASMGIARLRTGETAPPWIERADRALYAAKSAGRDRIEVDPVDIDEA